MTTHLAHVVDPARTVCCIARSTVPADTILDVEEADEDVIPPDICPLCLGTMHYLDYFFAAYQALGVDPTALSAATMTKTINAANHFARKETPDATAH